MSGFLGMPYSFLPMFALYLTCAGGLGALWFSPYNKAKVYTFLTGKLNGVIWIKGADGRFRAHIRKFITGEPVRVGKASYTLPSKMNNYLGVPVCHFDEKDTLSIKEKLVPTEFAIEFVDRLDKAGKPIPEYKDNLPTGNNLKEPRAVPVGKWSVIYEKGVDEMKQDSATEVDSIIVSTKAMLEAEAMKTFLKKIMDLLNFTFWGVCLIGVVVIGLGALSYSQNAGLSNLVNQTLQQSGTQIKMLTEIATKIGGA